jgi:putative endonuclease
MKHNQMVGKWGEQAAADYLVKKGYSILERNIRTPYGEIDIVASIEDLTIFVEVKTRTSHTFGLPEEALTYRKLSHVRTCAEYYAIKHNIDSWQCDAISIERVPGSDPLINHFENVIS